MYRDIQSEKLSLIEWIAKVNDIHIIQEFIALKEKKETSDPFSKYTQQDMISRAEESLEDIANGKTISSTDFKNELDLWKKSKDMK